jgi:hypothetical protein
MNQGGERVRGLLGSSASERPEAGEDGLRFVEVDTACLTAVPRVPADRRPLELHRLAVAQKQDELEGFAQADVLELRGRGEGDRRVTGVERATEPREGRSRRHERLFAQVLRQPVERGARPTIPCACRGATGSPYLQIRPRISTDARELGSLRSMPLSRSAQGSTLRPCIAAPMLPLRCVRSRCPRARECSPVARGPSRVKEDC